MKRQVSIGGLPLCGCESCLKKRREQKEADFYVFEALFKKYGFGTLADWFFEINAAGKSNSFDKRNTM